MKHISTPENKSFLSIGFVVALLLGGVFFHHGWSNYDQEKVLDYTGIITNNDIGNPHTYIDFKVIDQETEITEWFVVLAPLNRMRNRGMTDDSMLSVGDTVRVVGYPHRTTKNEMRAERIIIGDLTVELR